MDIEHPDITRTLTTGYPGGDPTYPLCPACGRECDEIFFNDDHEIVGCNECLYTKSAWFVDECFE